jgi:hypothetical protein
MKFIFTFLLILFNLESHAQWIDKIKGYELKSSLVENKISKIEVWYHSKYLEQIVEVIFIDNFGDIVERRFIYNNDTTDFDLELYSFDIKSNTSIIKRVNKFRGGCAMGEGLRPTKKIIRANSEGKILSETSYWNIKKEYGKKIKQRYVLKYHYDNKGLLLLIEGISKKKPESSYTFKYFKT